MKNLKPINSKDDLIKAYPERFEGIGKFPGTYHIYLIEDVQGLSVSFACVGSSDPVKVLCLYTMNTLDIL